MRTSFDQRPARNTVAVAELRRWRPFALVGAALAFGVLMAACGSPAAPELATTPPTAVAETVTTLAAAAPEADAAAPDWLQTASLDGDRFVLGNPDAPVRLLDYSDFL